MNDLTVLEVPLRKADILGPKQSALLLSSMNPYQNNAQLNGQNVETDIYDTTLGAFNSHSQFNDLIKVQDPYNTESDLNVDSANPKTSKGNKKKKSSSKHTDKKPIFDNLDDEKHHHDNSSSTYLDSYAYSYSYTFSRDEYEVDEDCPNENANLKSRSSNLIYRSCEITTNRSNISDDEIQKFKKSNALSATHDIKKMNVQNDEEDKDHVSWTFPQQRSVKIGDEEAPIERTADKYKVDLNEDDEEAVVYNNDPVQRAAIKLQFSPYFMVDASYQMVEESDNEYDEYDEQLGDTVKIHTTPESEMQLTPEQKATLQSGSPAASLSTMATITTNSDPKNEENKTSSSNNLPSTINEPSPEIKRKSPRNKKNVRFGNIANSQPEKTEDLNMFSESACVLSESERECYNIEEVNLEEV